MKINQNRKILILLSVLLLLYSLLILYNYNQKKSILQKFIYQNHNLVPHKIKLSDLYIYDKLMTKQKVFQEIKITSYYNGDSYNSSNITASGKSIDDFDINENGWYTYKGLLVIACATNTYKINKLLKPDYNRYDFGDKIILIINDVSYKGIILDICGASYWIEEKQRYDLFVSDKESAIYTNARVKSYEKEGNF